MQQLARMAEEVNRLGDSESGKRFSLGECLSGDMFDCVVEATKSICCEYEDSSDRIFFS
jgi:hypothetical protein